jgi:hypothetical protein
MVTILKSHINNYGLGNLLFTLAAGYALSIRDGKPMYSTEPKGFSEYSDNILRNIEITRKIPGNIYVEKSFNYSEIPVVNGIDGYFQSEKYFVDYRDFILDFFSPTLEIQKYIDSKYGDIIKDSTSIHIRRGDYLNYPDIHPVCDMDYYKKAIQHFSDKESFVVFSDDIDWCKKNFSNKFYFVEGEKDYIDLYIMSQCKNNIIANSTFSWWGAWLNKNEVKKVIAPKKWFGSKINHNTNDLVPSNWERI